MDIQKIVEARIEELIQEIALMARQEARTAVLRAFQAQKLKQPPQTKPKTRRSPKASPRSPEQIEQISEQLYRAIEKNPGQTMSALAPMIEQTPYQLKNPMLKLKQQGRVRTVGRKQAKRYFPTGYDERAPQNSEGAARPSNQAL